MTLKGLREKAGLTQLHVAKKLNVSPIAVSQWENGKNGIASKYFRKLGRMYGVPETSIVLASQDAQKERQNKSGGKNNERIDNL